MADIAHMAGHGNFGGRKKGTISVKTKLKDITIRNVSPEAYRLFRLSATISGYSQGAVFNRLVLENIKRTDLEGKALAYIEKKLKEE